MLTLGQLYVVAVTAGVGTVFFDVAYQSYLPVVVAREHLVDGNGKLGATQSFAQVAGPGLGGGLVGLVGAARAMAADAISLRRLGAVSAGRSATARTPRPRDAAGRRCGPRSPRGSRSCSGTRSCARSPRAPAPRTCSAAWASALEIVFLIRVLRVRPADTGLLIAVASLGGVAGGVLAGRLGRRIGSARIIWYSMLVLGFPSCSSRWPRPAGASPPSPVGMAFFSFAAVVYNVAQVSYRQAICPPRLLGRMNAAIRWVVWGTIPLGALLGGALGTSGRRPPHAVDRLRRQLGGGLMGVLLAARRERDLEDHGAPGGGVPGQGGRELPGGAGPQLGDEAAAGQRA